MFKTSSPIVVYDSGLGGLSFLEEALKRFPKESFLYFADTLHCPYGEKSSSEIVLFMKKSFSFIEKFSPKLLFIACHTISCIKENLDLAQDFFSFPCLDMLKPTLSIPLDNKIKKIAILGTEATIQSNIYQKKFEEKNLGLNLIPYSCGPFVSLVEKGLNHVSSTFTFVREWLSPLKEEKVDAVLLACTHFSFLKKAILSAIGKEVVLLDPNLNCIDFLEIEMKKMRNPSSFSLETEFIVTKDAPQFEKHAKELLKGIPISAKEQDLYFLKSF